MGIFSSWRHIAPVLRRQFRWERVAISRSAADILEQSLGGRLRKYDQEAHSPPRGARYLDQGEPIDNGDCAHHLTGSVLRDTDRSAARWG